MFQDDFAEDFAGPDMVQADVAFDSDACAHIAGRFFSGQKIFGGLENDEQIT